MSDILTPREFAERTEQMHRLMKDFVRACDRSIEQLTPEMERDHPGTRLVLFRKRKAARELLTELESTNIAGIVARLELHFARIDIEGIDSG